MSEFEAVEGSGYERSDERPRRIQLKRTKGWRLGTNARSVARPTKWGNPFRVPKGIDPHIAVMAFEDMVLFSPVTYYHQGIPYPRNYPSLEEIEAELAGHDLACWCAPDRSCHASVLLRLANR